MSFYKFHNPLCMCITSSIKYYRPMNFLIKYTITVFSDALQKNNLPENSHGGKFGRQRCIQEEERQSKVTLRKITNRHKEPPSLY